MSAPLSPLGRPLVIKPRTRGYRHRPIITVVDGVGLTEHGEVVHNLPLFASSTEAHIWCAYDVASYMEPIRDWFDPVNWFTWTFSDSRDPEPDIPQISKARLSNFGIDNNKARSAGLVRKMGARHIVWEPSRMFSDPRNAVQFVEGTHAGLQKFAQDVRAWCKEQDLQIRGTLPSLAAQLLRDGRFWPHLRGRVPRATNERLRRTLPGVYQKRLAPLHQPVKLAISLDQKRAYHRAAQTVPTPDPTTLFARGHFLDAEGSRIWAPAGSELYRRTLEQPGVVALRGTARPARKGEFRLPAVDKLKNKEGVIFLYTNEVQDAVASGLRVIGITAAWTSLEADTGLPLYGAFAEREIDAASDYRAQWLKPTLHSAYGMLGSRQRAMVRSARFMRGRRRLALIQGVEFPVYEGNPRLGASPLTNVAMLGTLQAEIRRRSLDTAATLARAGARVLHVHADGLHVEAGPIPFPPEGWTLEPLTNLMYEDDVSWLSDERDVLPGRDTRVRVELRRHRARLFRTLSDAGKAPTEGASARSA